MRVNGTLRIFVVKQRPHFSFNQLKLISAYAVGPEVTYWNRCGTAINHSSLGDFPSLLIRRGFSINNVERLNGIGK